MTVRDLGKQTRLGPKRIEDIEAGLETWLSSPIRQRLANALSIEPYLLKEVEIKSMLSIHPELEDIPGELYENLQALILSGVRDLECPRCKSELRASVKEGVDIEEQPIRFATAHCVRCPFII